MNDPYYFKCRGCDSTSFKLITYIKSKWPLSRCNSCNTVQIQKKPSTKELEKIYSDSYFSKGKYGNDFAGKKEQERRLEFMRRAGIKNGSKVLDFGMATGEFISVMRDSYDVWGIDRSKDAVDVAKRAFPELSDRLFSGAIDNLAFPEGYFDAIVLWDVIEHLDAPKETLSQLKRLLVHDGYLFISTPNYGTLTAKLMGKRWHFMTPPEHLVFYDQASLIKMCSYIGMTMQQWMTKGKWVNLGFLLYKLRRVMPAIMPQKLQMVISKSVIGRWCLYVPTGDIQYLAVKSK